MNQTATAPAGEVAILGGGCFWCLEAVFAEVDGVLEVCSGYAGGHTDAPAYDEVCRGDSGHAEVVRVVFDPLRISYREVLEIFFAIHDPTTLNRQGNDVGTQYRSVIFTTSATQDASARALIEEIADDRLFHAAIVTAVEPAPRFWAAEAEHHQYYARNPGQAYCQYVVAPKLAKFRERFAARRRRG
ncbi:peptide-methionine (S)-S-oxide reductase MsrA [Pseudothauera lacus]|uniref:Peptide methionine sulfoxide reductase MsrA n=1 Tax=Pseudothauera lacus TaxID=2136175 RepID=A0A2T4IG34_9RHOO|nr:peptide-methionine (S)-S-oxide reductase MsrA [Pseudothauera lacus]PTD96734.1 peptide-methionine (S)-S-oxide reductase [Pseudothauera lacus]